MILGAIALVAIGVVLVARRRRPSARPGLASRLLVTLARDAAPESREWPLAMLAEHDAIDDPRERDRFARGAVVAIVTRRPWIRTPGRVDVVVDGACMVAAISLATTCLVVYPGLRAGTTWIVEAVLFGLGLAAYGCAALVASRFGTRTDHVVGAAAGLSAGVLGVLVGLLPGQSAVRLASLVILLPAGAVLTDRLVGRSRATPWVAGCTSALTAGLSFFVGFVTTSLATSGGAPTAAALAQAQRSGIHPFSAWAIGDALGGASFMLVYALAVGTLIGLGTAAAARSRA